MFGIFIHAKVTNREKILRKFDMISPNIRKSLEAVQLSEGLKLAERIKANAPKVRGKYADSIYAAPLRRQGGRGDAGFRGSNVAARTTDKGAVGIYGWFVWRYVEYGTTDTPAMPHINPTYRANKKQIRRRMSLAVSKAVRQATR